jgi:hypothetical protein
MFPGGASASAGDVPALHSLRVHAPHLGQVQQGLETEDRTLDLLLSTSGASTTGPREREDRTLDLLLFTPLKYCICVHLLPIGLFLFTFIVLNLAPFF